MRVNSAGVVRADIAERLQLVGNLIGAASVEVASKISGRLLQIEVRLGDPVARGQEVARIENGRGRRSPPQVIDQHRRVEHQPHLYRSVICDSRLDPRMRSTYSAPVSGNSCQTPAVRRANRIRSAVLGSRRGAYTSSTAVRMSSDTVQPVARLRPFNSRPCSSVR